MDAGGLTAIFNRNWLCYATLVLTLYFKEPPSRKEALVLIDAYRQVCPPDRIRYVCGGDAPAFADLTSRQGQSLVEQSLNRMDRRKDVGIVFWDGLLRHSWSLTVQGMAPHGGVPRASFCQLFFPVDIHDHVVIRAARLLADGVDFLSGHAGVSAVFNAEYKATAFDRIYAWAKRHPGLDVVDLNLTPAYVVDRIKGASWLTLVGSELADRLGSWNERQELDPEVKMMPAGNGMLLQAGSRPELGDRNRREWPASVASVERALVKLKLESHPEFAGRFEAEAATWPWFTRFLRPEVW